MFYLYGNWKSYKNISDTRSWFDAFTSSLSTETLALLSNGAMEIVVFPPAPLIYPLHTLCIGSSGIGVGAQDISAIGEGKETGLINGSSLKGLASHVIIGHVEQRKRGDTQEVVMQKYEQTLQYDMQPVLCASKPDEIIQGVHILAFEPVGAIGTGNNAAIEDVSAFATLIDRKNTAFLYGGSVNETNCSQYLKPALVDGFLIGAISLDAGRFAALANTCALYVAQ